jgi:hypothetical protein
MRRLLLPAIACAALIALGLLLALRSSREEKHRAAAEETSDRRAASVPPSAAGRNDESPPRHGITRIDAARRAQLRAAIARARAARSDKPQTAAAQATPPSAEDEGAPASTRERIRKHIGEVVPLLAECYELERARKPDLAGNLMVRFTIDGEPEVGGIVSESEVTGGTLAQSQEMVTCVRETLFTAKFDPPESGGTIVVEYPFVFGTK